MKKIIDNLAWLFGALSIARLLKEGFDFGVIEPMARVLDYYEKSARLLFGWAEPYLGAALQWTGLNLRLYPQWKHVLVLMWLYVGVVTKVNWPVFKSRRQHALLLVLTAWGVFVALGASLGAGAVALRDGRSNEILAFFPLFGFVLYQLALAAVLATWGRQETWWIRYRAAARLFVGPSTMGVIVVALILATLTDRVPFLRLLPNPGLALLFVLVVILAFRWLWTGVVGAVHKHKPEDGSWWHTFHSMTWWKSWLVMGNTRIGLSMLRAIGGAVAFILLGAGLE